MKQNFCTVHTIAFLKGWDGSNKPLDRSLSDYFRSHKSLGSHDRKTIGEWIYSLIRWKSLFDEIDPSGSNSKRLHLLQQRPIEQWIAETTLSTHARMGLSPFLWTRLLTVYGDQKAREIAKVFSSQGPITVRANLLKTSRKELMALWDGKFLVRACLRSPAGIIFAKREPLFSLPEFKQGLFEMQDEGSQLIADLVEAKPGDRILDYCSGSGGKSLAFAPPMLGKGEIYLHDIRATVLREAKIRLKRAGIQNAQVIGTTHPMLKKIVGKMDWVLADVPCSGTGVLRRNPDMKWKIDDSMIKRLIQEQKTIFQQAICFAKPKGRIVYATCSILPEENELQVQDFLAHFPVELEKKPITLTPEQDGCDGFFGAVFRKL